MQSRRHCREALAGLTAVKRRVLKAVCVGSPLSVSVTLSGASAADFHAEALRPVSYPDWLGCEAWVVDQVLVQ